MRRSLGGLRLLGAGARCSDFDRVYRSETSLAPVVQSFDPLSLSSMRQAALLTMHESHIKRSLIRELLEDSQDKPGHDDYRALAELGLGTRNPGKRYHDLTSDGRLAAKSLEQSLCKQFGIHLFLGPKGTGETVSFSCPCGWTQSFRNSHTAPGNARASWNRHVSTVEGMQKLFVALKPPARAEG